jgi:uncharacterized repeat protein (TIGR04138 family)
LLELLARDPNYAIPAYQVVMEVLEGLEGDEPQDGHVSARRICEGIVSLAVERFGMLAATVLERWGIRSTGDIGRVVANLIASGDLEAGPDESPADFENLFDLRSELDRMAWKS